MLINYRVAHDVYHAVVSSRLESSDTAVDLFKLWHTEEVELINRSYSIKRYVHQVLIKFKGMK